MFYIVFKFLLQCFIKPEKPDCDEIEASIAKPEFIDINVFVEEESANRK